MAIHESHRPTREWSLLILAIGLVGIICFPFWQAFSASDPTLVAWTDPDRWAQLLMGPEKVLCYLCFTWASFILASRFMELRRQRRAFKLPLLPTEPEARILHDDVIPLQRQIDQATRKRPLILSNMIRVALSKFSLSRSNQEAAETIRTQAEVEHGRMANGMALVHYLAWALPAIGFLGTVRGLSGSMSLAGKVGSESSQFVKEATDHLGVAFDCTLVALFLSIIIMLAIHLMQRAQEALIIDCQQYCLDHLINRIYEPRSLDHKGQSVVDPDSMFNPSPTNLAPANSKTQLAQ